MKTVLACAFGVHFVLFLFFCITVLGTIGALTASMYVPEVAYANLRLGLYYVLACFVPIVVKVVLRHVDWGTFALQASLLALSFLMQAMYQLMHGDDFAHDACLAASCVCALSALGCVCLHAQYLNRLKSSDTKKHVSELFRL